MDVFLIRHGESFNNALEDIADRVPDPPLTDRGVRQAERLAAHVAAGGHLYSSQRGNGRPLLDELYCSPMIRAMQTAQPIGKALDLSPNVWIDIHEVGGLFLDHGDDGVQGFPGKTRQQIAEEFEGFTADSIADDGWWRGTREAEQEGRGRAIGVAATLASRAAEEVRIGLVSHGDFISGLLKAMANHLPSRGVWYEHDNTAITHMNLADGRLVVKYMNRTAHLTEDLLS